MSHLKWSTSVSGYNVLSLCLRQINYTNITHSTCGKQHNMGNWGGSYQPQYHGAIASVDPVHAVYS